MDVINLKSLNLRTEESEGIIKFLPQKRGITTKKLLSTIKLNLKRKNNKDLTKSQQKLIKSIKSQQKLAKTQLALIKPQQKLIKSIKSQQKLTKQTKSQRELIKSQRKLKKQTLSNTKEIRKHLYNIENNNNNELDNNNNNEDFIENIRDFFSVLDYEPVLIKPGFDGNYLEYMSNGSNSLSFDEYLELIRPYLDDLINVYKTKGEWKLQLSEEISFVSQKPGSDETRVMYTRSFCEEIMSGSETEEITEKLIMSLLQKYQDNLQNKMKGSDFIFNGVNYLFHDFNRITISKGGSYIESPKWLKRIKKDKKCTINQRNNDNKCFQYAPTPALNFNKIDKHPQKYRKLNPLLIIIIGMILIFLQLKKIGISLNLIIKM